MGKLDGKIALITGGTSGIGGASAALFASEGAKIIITARNEQRGQQKVKEIISNGGECEFVKCDISCKSDVNSLKQHILGKYGELNILFNNAGLLITNPLENITEEEWDKMYAVNIKGGMFMCQTFVDLLKKSHGVILNNASINGLNCYIKGRSSYMYATSKAAMIQFSKYVAKNYAPEIRCNVLCPGMTVTNLFTNKDFSRFDDCNLLGRMAHPDEIAKVALFLVCDDSSFITGATIVADGGETIK